MKTLTKTKCKKSIETLWKVHGMNINIAGVRKII